MLKIASAKRDKVEDKILGTLLWVSCEIFTTGNGSFNERMIDG
jgi:hypothetical protein